MDQHQTTHLLNHINDLRHVIRYSWFKRRWQAMQIHHITAKLFAVASAQTDWIFPQFICPSNYLQNLKSAYSAILSHTNVKEKKVGIWHTAHVAQQHQTLLTYIYTLHPLTLINCHFSPVTLITQSLRSMKWSRFINSICELK